MATIIDSYSEANQDGVYNFWTDIWGGQSFTGDRRKLTSVKFYIRRVGSPTGTVKAQLFAHTGTFGTSSNKTGSALASSSEIDVATLDTDFGLVEFIFEGENQISLSNGTHYCIQLTGFDMSGDVPNCVSMGRDLEGTHSGNFYYNAGVVADSDLCFYVYGAKIGPFPTFFKQ